MLPSTLSRKSRVILAMADGGLRKLSEIQALVPGVDIRLLNELVAAGMLERRSGPSSHYLWMIA